MGEDLDPQQFKKIEKTYNDLGIAIKSSATTIRPLDDILGQLGQKWSSLSDVQKNQIAIESAGIRQKNIFLSTMNSWSEVLTNTTAALNSQGVALQKQDIYMQSVQAHVNQFVTVLQSLYANLSKSSTLSGLIDLGTGGLKALSSLSNTIGTIPALLTAATFAMSLFSKSFRNGFIDIAESTVTSFSGLKTSLEGIKGTNIAETLMNTKNAMIALKDSAIVTKIAMAAFEATVTLGLSVALSFAITKVMEIVESQKSASEQIKNLSSDITKSSSDIIKAQNLLAEKNITTDKNKLLDIERQLAQVLPSTADGFDAEGNAISQNSQIINDYIQLQKQSLDLKKQQMSDKFQSTGNDLFNGSYGGIFSNGITQQMQQIEQYKNQKQSLLDAVKVMDGSPSLSNGFGLFNSLNKSELTYVDGQIVQITTDLNANKEQLKNLGAISLDTSANMKTLGDTLNQKVANGLVNIASKGDITKLFSSLETSKFGTILSGYNKAIDDYGKKLKVGNNTAQDDANIKRLQISSTSQLIAMMVQLGANYGVSRDKAQQFIYSLVSGIPNATKVTNELSTSQDDLLKMYSDSSSKVADYNQLLYDMSKNKEIDAKRIGDLIAKYPELSGVISANGKTIDINKQGLIQLRDTEVNAIQIAISAEDQHTLNMKSQVDARLQAIGLEITALSNYAKAYADVMTNGKTNLLGLNPFQESATSQVTNTKGMLDAASAIQKNIDLQKQLKNIEGSNNFGVNLDKSKTTDKVSGDHSLENQLEKYISLIQQAKTEYQQLTNLTNRKIDLGVISGKDILDTKVKNYQQYVDKIWGLEDNLNSKIADISAKRNDYKVGTKEWNQATALISKYKSDLSKLPGIQEQSVNKLSEMNTQLENQNTWIEHLKDVTDSWSKKIEDTVTKIKDIGSAFNDSISEISKNEQLNKKFGTDMFGTSQDFLSQTIDAYKTELLAYSKSFDDIYKVLGDKAEQFKKLSVIPEDQMTGEQKAIWDAINSSAQLQQELQKQGLTIDQVKAKNAQFIDLINKYKQLQDASKYVEDLTQKIKDYASSFADFKSTTAFDDSITEKYKKFTDAIETTPTTAVDKLQKQLDDAKTKFNNILDQSKELEKMKNDGSSVDLQAYKDKAKQIVNVATSGFDGSQFKGFFDSFNNLWSGNTQNLQQFQSTLKDFESQLGNKSNLSGYYDSIVNKLKQIEDLKQKASQTTDSSVLSGLQNQANTIRNQIQGIVQNIVNSTVSTTYTADQKALNDAITSATSYEDVTKTINDWLAKNNTELQNSVTNINDIQSQLDAVNKQLEVTKSLKDVFTNVFSFSNLWKDSKDEFGNIIHTLNDQVVKTLQTSSDLVDEVFAQVKTKLSDTMTSMLTDQGGFVDKLLSGSGISDAFAQTFTDLQDKFSSTLSNLGTQASTYFSGSFQFDLLKGMGNLDGVLSQLMTASLDSLPTVVGDVLAKLPEMFNTLTSTMSTGVINSLTTILNQAITVISQGLKVDLPLLANITPTVNKIDNTATETTTYQASTPTNYHYYYSINAGNVISSRQSMKDLATELFGMWDEMQANKI